MDLSHNNWCNGNPHLQIKAGTYPQYRDHLKGFTESQLAEFDAEWDAAVKAAGKDGIETEADIIARKTKANEVAAKARKAARKAAKKPAAKKDKDSE